MLASFAKHLKEKGWFDICTIAMDERPMDVMQKTLKVIRKADPDFKVSLAGNYHAEIEPDLYDYCIVIGQNYPEDVRLRRKAENKRTTYYTCCLDEFLFFKEASGRLSALGVQQLAVGAVARFPFPYLGSRRYLSGIPRST